MANKKFWLCSASDERVPQVRVLGTSVTRHTDYQFGRINPARYVTDARHIELIVTQQRLSAALKLLKEGAQEVIISGADYLVCGPLPEIKEDYGHYACLFCPHVLELMPEMPHQQNINLTRAGVINSDFQVWRNSLKVRNFLTTVIAELKGPIERMRDSFDFEQVWLPYALSCAQGGLITHPGYGVAYYNLHERKIVPSLTTGQHTIDTAEKQFPLRTFHFSGMEFQDGARLLTKYGHPFSRQLTSTEHGFIHNYRERVKIACAEPPPAQQP